MSTPIFPEDYPPQKGPRIVNPTQAWTDWLEGMRVPEKREGESDEDWTDRIALMGAGLGRNRQCSIGWHDECSTRAGNLGGCECPCHKLDKGRLAEAMRELESERALLIEMLRRHVMDWGRCESPYTCNCSDAAARRLLDNAGAQA